MMLFILLALFVRWIDSEILPRNVNLSIDIGSKNITLKSNAFNQMKIDRLRFSKVDYFNGRSVFDTNWFGNNLEINELIFEQCNLTGFSNSVPKATIVTRLAIINSPKLTQLTSKNLPAFLSTTKSLEISNTSLQMINTSTFQAWSLVLEELIIIHNFNLEIFPSHITKGILMNLNKLDLSYNSIHYLDPNYNWHAYSYTKELFLKGQPLDLFLQTNILSQLPLLERIDFSYGFIREESEELNYFPSLPNLKSIDISYTNLSEIMVIDLLTKISQMTNRSVNIHSHGHVLSDDHFCAYFTIFKNAPNLLNLQLDDWHECNCVIDLFFRERSDLSPSCLLNSSRRQCDIRMQLSRSKCLANSHPSKSVDQIGNYAFSGFVAGLTILVLVLLSLGVTGVYRIRRRRRNTDLTMEEPLANPSDAIIEEFFEQP